MILNFNTIFVFGFICEWNTVNENILPISPKSLMKILNCIKSMTESGRSTYTTSIHLDSETLRTVFRLQFSKQFIYSLSCSSPRPCCSFALRTWNSFKKLYYMTFCPLGIPLIPSHRSKLEWVIIICFWQSCVDRYPLLFFSPRYFQIVSLFWGTGVKLTGLSFAVFFFLSSKDSYYIVSVI